jgi:DNA-binding PadR family transcriptional regulator
MFENQENTGPEWFRHHGRAFQDRGFGGRGQGGPRFERGDIKLVILGLLQEKPRHGYDILQALEAKFHGFYKPSSGTVYPTLELLADQDLVTRDEKSGKKVYTITDAGTQYLKEHQIEHDAMESRMEGPWGAQGQVFREVGQDMREIMRKLFFSLGHKKLNAAQKQKLHIALQNFKNEITEIVSEDGE